MNKVFLLVLSAILISSCNKSDNARIRNTETVTIHTSDWMQELIAQYPGISLYDISIPGAHDAGLYILSNCTFGTNACNTKTQYQTAWNMLLDGVRIFDVRPAYFNNKFYTQHGDCGFFNCKGDLLENFLEQTSQFLDSHNELVIFELGLFCDTAPDDTAFVNLVNRKLGDKIYKEAAPDATPFMHRKLKDILTGNKGKVLLLAGVEDTPENRANGFFADSYISFSGSWTNSHNYADLQTAQGANFHNYVNDGSSLFAFSWQITLSNEQSVACAINPNAPSIEKNAKFINKKLNGFLDSLQTAGDLQRGRIPNVIWSDFTDTLVTKECIRRSIANLE